MIRIEYNRQYRIVTVKGHAGSGPAGHDIVCAAVSALLVTLAAEVQELKRRGSLWSCGIRLDDGDAAVTALPMPWAVGRTTTAFDVICRGFSMLARDWPEHVKFIVL